MTGLKYGLAAVVAMAFIGGSGVANAQSVVIREYNSVVVDDFDDDAADVVEDFEEDVPEVVEVSPIETRVYGWIGTRPYPNCGRLHYWDGVSCLDARLDPPFAD